MTEEFEQRTYQFPKTQSLWIEKNGAAVSTAQHRMGLQRSYAVVVTGPGVRLVKPSVKPPLMLPRSTKQPSTTPRKLCAT